MPVVPKSPRASDQIADLQEGQRSLFRMLRKALASSTPAASGIWSARSERTSGNLTINSVTWTDLDTATDLLLPAKALDVVEVALAAVWGNEAVIGQLDVVSVTSAPVISWGRNAAPDNAHGGVPAWIGGSGLAIGVGGSVLRPLTSAEVVDGLVRLRVRVKTATAANKTLSANSNVPLVFTAKNLGQP